MQINNISFYITIKNNKKAEYDETELEIKIYFRFKFNF